MAVGRHDIIPGDADIQIPPQRNFAPELEFRTNDTVAESVFASVKTWPIGQADKPEHSLSIPENKSDGRIKIEKIVPSGLDKSIVPTGIKLGAKP